MPKIDVSERKRNANRANALKSTGPRTIAGKAKSRFNALTHGMRAEMLVLPTEDPAAFEAERQGWIEDWKPKSQTRMALVELAVAQSWRLKRCMRVEAARLTKIADEAAEVYDAKLNARLDHGLRLIESEPLAGLKALGSDPSGIQLLADAWNVLGSAVEYGPRGWNKFEAHHGRLMNLLGLPSDFCPEDVNAGTVASFRLLQSNLGELPEGETLSKDEANDIAASLADWTKARADLWLSRLAEFEDPAVFRAREIESECVDVSPEGLALQRYELAHDRAFRSTITQLVQMAKTDSDLIAPNEATDDTSDLVPVSCDDTIEKPAESSPPREPRLVPALPSQPTDDLARTADRDREGRIWGVEESDPGLMDQ
jgi:hypothetical protein